MKAIVLVASLVMAATLGCSRNSGRGLPYCVEQPEGEWVRPDTLTTSRLLVIHRHRFVPLYHRYGTQWLAWLADGRPNEEGS